MFALLAWYRRWIINSGKRGS